LSGLFFPGQTLLAQETVAAVARSAYFGDLHIHTQNSFDAFLFGARATPDDAYRYAKGEKIQHPSGFSMQLKNGPLDFAAVTDHGKFMGVLPELAKLDGPLSRLDLSSQLRSSNREDVGKAIRSLVDILRLPKGSPLEVPELSDERWPLDAWQQTIDAAQRHNQPGRFTTFVAYEYSPAPQNQNLHRNVIFRSNKVPRLPFSSADSGNPEQLWHWMDARRTEGIEALAIPHNSNVSNGLMFQRVDWNGKPFTSEYAALRMRNEPVVEVTQVKGTSETHPFLSPNDEWAGFELYDYLIASLDVSKKSGGFVREAYRVGLEFQASSSFNPYTFGLIGSTDSHNAGGSFEESNYVGKVGRNDGLPKLRGSVPADENIVIRNPGFTANIFSQWNASGLAGVWAEENTREAIYSAFRRKEVFATSGPRIRVRFFAGRVYPDDILHDPKMLVLAYEKGVPMGGTIKGGTIKGGTIKGVIREGLNRRNTEDISPVFIVLAMRDPDSAGLQRLQIIKGWVEEGVSSEQVYDVACSDNLKPDKKSRRCPENGAGVDLSNCQYSGSKGANQLSVAWRDPDFKRHQQAFYYVRVLENPSCRWSTWDALRAGVEPNPELKATIQERAWSSPIWYRPAVKMVDAATN